MDDFDFYRLYKTLHVIAVTPLAGGITVETVIGPLMVRVQSVQELRLLARLSKLSENFIILPSLLLVIGFGYATAARRDIDLETTWLLLGQVLTFVAALASIGYLRSASLRLNRLANEAPDGPIPDGLRRELKNPGPPVVGGLLAVVFVFIIYLMVAQPNW